MKAKVIIVVIILLLAGGGGGFYFYYNSVLRFTDGFTDCPVADFRVAATSADAAVAFVSEQSLVSLAITERCSLDCTNDNHMACVLYGLAKQEGVYVMKSDEESRDNFRKACDRGVALGCDLEKRAAEKVEQAEKAAAREKARESFKEVLQAIEESKRNIGGVMKDALAFFGGNTGPMQGGRMLKWYEGTVSYLLFDKPGLSRMHQVPGMGKLKKTGLKDFVLTKYMGGKQEPDYLMIKEFFEKLMRLGVGQIKLDERVEKKKESDLPKRHPYFRAKHTFLYNAGETHLEIIEEVEKDINYKIENQ